MVLIALHNLVPKNKRAILPYFSLLLYTLIGGAVFYGIEQSFTQTQDSRADVPTKCITTWSSGWFFSMAACSTIGFGVVYPCTHLGRVLSVFYILLGVPQLLLVLADIGTRLCGIMTHVWGGHLRRQRERRERKQREAEIASPWGDFDPYIDPLWVQLSLQEEFEEKKKLRQRVRTTMEQVREVDIPVWIGILLTLFCFVLLALYYMSAEAQSFLEGFYGACLTYLAGDYTVTNFPVAAPCYVLVFIGFAMLSTTIRIVQNNIDNFVKKIKREVEAKVEEMQALVDSGEIDQETADAMIQDVLDQQQKKGGIGASLMTNMVSKKEMDGIHDYLDQTARHVALEAEIERMQSQSTMNREIQCDLWDTLSAEDRAKLRDVNTPSATDEWRLEHCVDVAIQTTNAADDVATDAFLQFLSKDKNSRVGALATMQFPRAKNYFTQLERQGQQRSDSPSKRKRPGTSPMRKHSKRVTSYNEARRQAAMAGTRFESDSREKLDDDEDMPGQSSENTLKVPGESNLLATGRKISQAFRKISTATQRKQSPSSTERRSRKPSTEKTPQSLSVPDRKSNQPPSAVSKSSVQASSSAAASSRLQAPSAPVSKTSAPIVRPASSSNLSSVAEGSSRSSRSPMEDRRKSTVFDTDHDLLAKRVVTKAPEIAIQIEPDDEEDEGGIAAMEVMPTKQKKTGSSKFSRLFNK